MSSNRLFQYDLSDPAARRARAILEQCCARYHAAWPVQFRQKDLYNAFKSMFDLSAQHEYGLCQVVAVMYSNIRDLFMGDLELSLAFFQAWVTRDVESATILMRHLPPRFNHQRILQDYFQGSKSFVATVDLLWSGLPARLTVARKENAGFPLRIFARAKAAEMQFRTHQHNDIATTIDVDFVHDCNPDYVLVENQAYKYLNNYHELAEKMVECVEVYLRDTQIIRCTLQLENANDKHAEPHMWSLQKLPDSNMLELVDANRGVLLIPCHNLQMMRDFFKDYLTLVYGSHRFNSVHWERFVRLSELTEMPKILLAQHNDLCARAEVRQRLQMRAKL